MGYSTDFEGSFQLDRQLSPAHASYLRAFAETRRMHRSSGTAGDPLRDAVGLPPKPEYFVSGDGFCGQDSDESVLNYNSPPPGQPGLWCQWVPSENLDAIEWDGHEKFYHYVEWLTYLIKHFLEPWGYRLNGDVEWEGEGRGDIGRIIVTDNVVSVLEGRIVFEEVAS